MKDPNVRIEGTGNDTRIIVSTPDGEYTYDDGEALRWVIDRHGEDFAAKYAKDHVPSSRDDFTWP